MSLSTESVPINTDVSGATTRTVRTGSAILRAVDIEIGTLSTPDIAITEEPGAINLLTLTGLAASGRFQPLVHGSDNAGASVSASEVFPTILSRIQIPVTGGGDTKTARLVLLLDR